MEQHDEEFITPELFELPDDVYPAGAAKGSVGSAGASGNGDDPLQGGNSQDGDTSEPQRQVIATGAVLLRNWLTPEQQRYLVNKFRQWAAGPVPPRRPLIYGKPMSVQSVSLGWHWQNYAYSRIASDVNGAPVLPMPEWLIEVGTKAAADAFAEYPASASARWYTREDNRFVADSALLNYYSPTAKMGMHQDKEESTNDPVVSFSLGDSCTFRFGNTESRNRPYQDVQLNSGDLFVFGGPSRYAYHGVVKIIPNTSPKHCDLAVGRINITLRNIGATHDPHQH
ncbi:alpha-ketoglutarate-dependent dioxygenase AlkB family protein [Neomicrococcus aestuarii]|uniref:alpha-ketoglutarate-dependent dioxygenase AlkB family protein n=1 Tax=Neomicrococcus aestuarii TaxID=556325 RepID=UPI000A0168C9|nr:alpha-ketoglutarate-dependent dioxygenase AlkB [Neomicrococcus aestuarii]